MTNTSKPIIWSTPSTSIAAFKEGLNQVVDQQAKTIVIMACSDNHYDEEQIANTLKLCPVPVCGGVFPKVLSDGQLMSEGVMIIGLTFDVGICNYNQLSSSETNIEQLIADKSHSIASYDSFIILADALCSFNEDFIHQFYDYMGSGITVIGGGTGFLDFVSRPSIFTNDGLIDDAVQIIGLPTPLSRGIGHGWEVLDGPYLVTASEGHRIDTLDYEPAFELYQNVIQRVSGEFITPDNFFDIAKNFPLGIVGLSGDVMVRDPIITDKGCLECVGNVPTNASVNILTGDRNKLIKSAETVANSLQSVDNAQMLMLFDCISRVLYLQDDFSQEIDALQGADMALPMTGVLSLGEITNTQSSAIHLLNKSTVIGMF